MRGEVSRLSRAKRTASLESYYISNGYRFLALGAGAYSGGACAGKWNRAAIGHTEMDRLSKRFSPAHRRPGPEGDGFRWASAAGFAAV
jgi:hypothetical protein